MNDFSYEITDHIATLSDGSWKLELNLVSWGGRTPTYDIRKWNGERMSKGCTLKKEELIALRDALNEYLGEE